MAWPGAGPKGSGCWAWVLRAAILVVLLSLTWILFWFAVGVFVGPPAVMWPLY